MGFINDTLFYIVGLTIFCWYQTVIFEYASNILIDSITNKFIFALISVINSIIFIAYNLLGIPFYLFFPFITLVLFLEFKLISHSDYIQSLCGATIFGINIGVITLPVILGLSFFYEITPIEVVDGDNYSYSILTLMITSLISYLVLSLVRKAIDFKSIRRITMRSKYSVLLLVCTMIILMYLSLNISLIVTDVLTREHFIIAIVTTISIISIFFFIFVYSMNLLDAAMFKRYSDNAIKERDDILQIKQDLARKISKDDLTGVYNRKYITNYLEQLCHDKKSEFSVLFIDINGLKYINDTLGHDNGDILIIAIAKALENALRDEDVIGRLGGDEFIAILIDTVDPNLDVIVSRINENIEYENIKHDFLVSASIGGLYITKEAKELGVSYIMTEADKLMRINKQKFYEDREGGN